MIDEAKYPYELKTSFFISLLFKRANQVPHPLELAISTEISIAEPEFPMLQIAMRVKTPEDSPLTFDIQMAGIFEYQGDKKEYDHELNIEYSFSRGVFLLWPTIIQVVRIITTQMGMNPVQIRTPHSFGSPNNVQASS